MTDPNLSRFTIADKFKDKNNDNTTDPIVKNAVEEAYLNPKNPGSYSGVSNITKTKFYTI